MGDTRMFARLSAVACLGVVFAIQSGCGCMIYQKQPWPCGGTYCGNHCGCFWWHEWFSHKPCCCEPCDCCGEFCGSDNPYVKSGPPRGPIGGAPYDDGSGNSAPGAVGELYS